MGRRSDHSRAELEALMLRHGAALMAETGYARFSAREVAKRVGYSVGTVSNLFGSVDGLVVAVNARTYRLWAESIERRLHGVAAAERPFEVVRGYFDFAAANPNLWAAIYDHRLTPEAAIPEPLAEARSALTGIAMREIAAVLPQAAQPHISRLAHSLIATVHGHCVFALLGSFRILGEADPLGMAVDRVRQALEAEGARL